MAILNTLICDECGAVQRDETGWFKVERTDTRVFIIAPLDAMLPCERSVETAGKPISHICPRCPAKSMLKAFGLTVPELPYPNPETWREVEARCKSYGVNPLFAAAVGK